MGKNLSWFATSSTKKFWIKGIDLSLNTCRMMRWHNWLSPFLLSTCKHIALDNPLGLTNPGKEDLVRVAWIHYYKCIMYTYVDMYTKISYFKKIFSEWSIHLVLGGMEQKVLNPNLSQFWAMKYIILLSFRELQICIFLILDLNMHPNLDKIGMKRKMKKEK